MLSDSEKQVVRSYMEKLFHALKERITVEKKINDLETSIRSILALHEDEDAMPYIESLYMLLPPEGFTDAIRRVLQSSSIALTPAQVKEKLPEVGFSLDGYSNPLASIHTILKRLALTETVDQEAKDGKTTYKWRMLSPLVSINFAKLSDLLKSSTRESTTSNHLANAIAELRKKKK